MNFCEILAMNLIRNKDTVDKEEQDNSAHFLELFPGEILEHKSLELVKQTIF